jgi:hypothetical protein
MDPIVCAMKIKKNKKSKGLLWPYLNVSQNKIFTFAEEK